MEAKFSAEVFGCYPNHCAIKISYVKGGKEYHSTRYLEWAEFEMDGIFDKVFDYLKHHLKEEIKDHSGSVIQR